MNHLRLNATLPRLKAKVNAMRHVDSLNVIGLGGGGGGGGGTRYVDSQGKEKLVRYSVFVISERL